MHCRHEEVAGRARTIAGEHPAGPIGAMRGGCQPEHEKARIRIAKTRYWFGPVGVMPKGRTLFARDLGAVRTKSRASGTRNDLCLNVDEGSSCESQIPNP